MLKKEQDAHIEFLNTPTEDVFSDNQEVSIQDASPRHDNKGE